MEKMNPNDLLFHREYEHFYAMAKTSKAFSAFCKAAFGEDFSQDGFSDLRQINRIVDCIPKREGIHILDAGCGNGKMLGYLQRRMGAFIHGFDYSQNAIQEARNSFPVNADFRQGCMGEIDYPVGSFDVITSMDTLYFAPDMAAFVEQLLRWLKKDGVLFVGYQEGDLMPKTATAHTTVFAQALLEKDIPYQYVDITKETYDLLLKKRQTALQYEKAFVQEGNQEWFDMLIGQTDCIKDGFDAFAAQMARYLYIVRK